MESQALNKVMLEGSFKNELDKLIKDSINSFGDFIHVDTMSDYKDFLKIYNVRDFWCGYLIARLEMDCANLFKTKYSRICTREEFTEIVKTVREYGNFVRTRINEKYVGMFGYDL
ncbi:MAG TPA: hypothetical protein VLD38_03600 [Nitrosopumilaceae archaeon]|nr:hypothetical protein [Nitrosopumilaceae archaeon]